MNTLLVVLGGIALILHGVRSLRKGLDRVLGDRLGPLLERASGKPVRALFTGVGLSLLAPSSTSVSTLAVQSVKAGHVSAARMLVVLLGADVGLTLTVQLLALKVGQVAPVFILLGVALYQYTKAARVRGVGQILLSFGFLFLGLGLIEQAAGGVEPHGDLAQVLQIAGRYPFWLAMMTAALAVGLQSSTATVGLLLGLSGAGGLVLAPESAVAAVCGANVGVAITLLLLGWDHPESRRLGVANLLTKFAVAAIVLALLPQVTWLLDKVTPSLSRLVADAHTSFNFLKLLVVLPLVGVAYAAACKLVPVQPKVAGEDPGRPRYLADGPVDGSSLALSQSMREVLRVAEIVRGMCDDVWRALRNDDEALAKQVSGRDNHVDRLEKDIKRFLARLDAHSLDPDQAAERLRQLTYLSELESIGDLVDKNLCELVRKKVRRRVSFTPAAWAAMDALDKQVSENMRIADAAFHTRDLTLAAKLLRHKDCIDRQVRQLRDAHLARVGDGMADEPHDASAVHLDVLTNLRRINSHVSHVAFALLQPDQDRPVAVGA